MFANIIRDEITFWETLDNNVFSQYDFNDGELQDIFSILEETRQYAKPTQNILSSLLKLSQNTKG